MRGPVGQGSQEEIEAVPQMTTRAPTASRGSARIADDAGRVVEIDVHAIGAGVADRVSEPGRLVVDRRIVPEDLQTLCDLVLSPGDPDCPTADDLRDLADRGPTAPAAVDTRTVSPASARRSR